MFYKTLCLTVLSFGFTIWSPTSTETLMMERSQNKIFCTILGLPIHSLMSGSIFYVGLYRSSPLGCLVNSHSLTAIAKIILLYRDSSPNSPSSSVGFKFNDSLGSLFLPSICTTLESSIQTGVQGINKNCCS